MTKADIALLKGLRNVLDKMLYEPVLGITKKVINQAIQVTHEHDIAIEQLKELGYELGEKIRTSDDCVSRKFMYELGATCIATRDKNDKLIALGTIENLPPVIPIHGTCKDCTWWKSETRKVGYCNACKHGHCSGNWDIGIYRKTKDDFYCADFDKRGDSDE